MATYAVLGGTGNCGSALIRNLLEQSSQNEIRIYCRNEPKLRRVIAEIEDNKQVKVLTGTIHDVGLMTECLRGTKAAFLVVSTNDNVPGCSLSQDLARTVVEALKRPKDTSAEDVRPPPIGALELCKPQRSFVKKYAFSRPFILADYLHSHSDWLSTIYIKPAGLSLDIARGHRLTLDEEESFLSYADLAWGMIEAADDDESRYDGKDVGVVNKSRGVGAEFPRGTPLCLLMGVIRHFFPWLHPYLPSGGPG